jgi:hypothetical protein
MFMISKKTGEPPVIIDSTKTKNQFWLNYYYFNNGFFNVDAAYKVDTVQRAKIEYEISTGKPYFLDTVQTTIATPC